MGMDSTWRKQHGGKMGEEDTGKDLALLQSLFLILSESAPMEYVPINNC